MDGITTGRLLALIRRFTGNLSNLTTTDKSSLVAAINEAAQSGGGGGGDEQFQKVYETTLEAPSESDELTITTADMGGTYVDAVVYALIPGDSNNTDIFVDYLSSSDDYIGTGNVSLDSNGTFATVALLSFGGLALLMQDGFHQNHAETESYIGFLKGTIEYPTQGITGISSIILSVGSDVVGATHVFPTGTTITVYARRKVTA